MLRRIGPARVVLAIEACPPDQGAVHQSVRTKGTKDDVGTALPRQALTPNRQIKGFRAMQTPRWVRQGNSL